MHRVVITGGPGVGKTTLLAALAERGYPFMPEVARAVIRERLDQGLPPRPTPEEFARAILERDVRQYREAESKGDLVFFDRGIFDALGMLADVAPLPEDEANRWVADYPYHPIVLFLPPWEEIYRTDGERDQSFSDAMRAHQGLWEWYTRLGYGPVIVPPGPVAERCQFVLSLLGEATGR